MSRFVSNKSCEMCHKIETGLTEMVVGKIKHYLCYKCMAVFAFDIFEFASHNLRNEFEAEGYTIDSEYGGYTVKAIPRASIAFAKGEVANGESTEST